MHAETIHSVRTGEERTRRSSPAVIPQFDASGHAPDERSTTVAPCTGGPLPSDKTRHVVPGANRAKRIEGQRAIGPATQDWTASFDAIDPGQDTNPSPAARTRVLLVDNRTVVREGLCALVDQQPDLTVVGQADGVNVARRVGATVDVIVTEIDLADAHGAQVVRALRSSFRDSAILILTLIHHPAKVQGAIEAGAHGYLLQTSRTADLLTGIRAVAAGETYLQPSLGIELARWHRAEGPGERLSPREEQILGLLAVGHTNGEIAEILGAGLRTVESHRGRINQKLGMRTRAELSRYAYAAGLVDSTLRQELGGQPAGSTGKYPV
jgi:DNA-binding NarL/FixJ family response regulator